MSKEIKNTIDIPHFRMRNDSKDCDKKLISNIRICSKDNFSRRLKNHRQSLPPITSPFLKKTVYGLFSDKNLKQTLPLLHNQENQSSPTIPKCHNFKQPIDCLLKTKEHDAAIQFLSKETGLLQKSKRLESTDKDKQHKFIKSISEVRHHPRYQLDNFIKDYQIRKPKNGRSSTEHSHVTIYQKLEDLNEKQELRGEGNSRSRNTNNGKIGVRVCKAPNYVTKQKMAKQLYGSQREDIRLVKSILKPNKGRMALDQAVQVKNYTKFIPGVISISD